MKWQPQHISVYCGNESFFTKKNKNEQMWFQVQAKQEPFRKIFQTTVTWKSAKVLRELSCNN